MKNIFLILLLLFFCTPGIAQTTAADTPKESVPVTPVDASLKLKSADEVSALFEDVVAVQRKSKVKAGKFLFAPLASFDFSDSPYTMYGLNLSFGYAFSEFWELYLTYTPVFVASQRNISKQVKELKLASGQQASIDNEKATSYIGLDLNWIPIYGKDSWGPYGIVRSDSFLTLSVGMVKFSPHSGLKVKLAVGKTFFFSENFNFRMQAGPSMIETYSQNQSQLVQKQQIIVGLVEAGLVFYF